VSTASVPREGVANPSGGAGASGEPSAEAQLRRSRKRYPIPGTLNVLLLVLVVAAIAGTWALPVMCEGRSVALYGGAFLFGVFVQPLYTLWHETAHDIFHRRRVVNDAAGFLSAAFLPSSFWLLHFVHLGHHMSNRSKRERIEYYAEGESRVARAAFYYAVLLGLNWLGFVIQTVVFTLLPTPLIRRFGLDRQLGATLPALSDGDFARIRLEVLGVVAVWSAVLAFTPVSGVQCAVYFASNALFYSQLRYIYHYEAPFDVVEGAYDLRAPRALTAFVLNATYHLTHHRNPKVPWLHLPEIARPEEQTRGFFEMLLRQWRGALPESSQPQRTGRTIAWNGPSMLAVFNGEDS
jgi:fatty acid desaturase